MLDFVPAADERDLRSSLEVLVRRKWMVALTVLVAIGAAVGVSLFKEPVYEARSELLLQASAQEALLNPAQGVRPDPQRAVDTEIGLLRSEPVREMVRRRVGPAAASMVSARPQGDSDIIGLTARSTSARRTAAVVNGYAMVFIEFRREREVARLTAAADELDRKVSALQGQLDQLDDQIAQAAPGGPGNLRSRRDALVAQQASLSERLTQLQVQSSLETGGVQLVAPASVPRSPLAPSPARDGALAAMVGLVVGVGLAYLLDQLDDSITASDDVEDVEHDVQVVGTIPRMAAWTQRHDAVLASLSEPHGPTAEGYRRLAVSLVTLGVGDDVRVLQVTSPIVGQGKTTTVANLAVELARTGRRVLAVGCDLHRPRLHAFFELSNEVGLSSALDGGLPLDALSRAVQRVPNVDGLGVVGSGRADSHDGAVLSGPRMQQVLSSLRDQADVVLVDSPPVLGVSDAAVLATKVDATLVIAAAGSTNKRQFGAAIGLLRQVSANLIGVALNNVVGEDAYYGEAYGYVTKGRRASRHTG